MDPQKKIEVRPPLFVISTPPLTTKATVQTKHSLVSFSNPFIVSMASMNPMILSFAESGLATFIRLYAEIHANNEIQGPEPSKLHEIMRSKLGEMEEELSKSVKRVQEDEPVSIIKEPVAVEPETPKEPAATSEPVQQESVSQATTSTKVDVRDLKKLTYKKKRQVTKGKNAGEEVEEEILVELPYLPHCVNYSSGCQALKLNGGLLNPCLTRPTKGSMFCKACGETPKFGTIADRDACQFGSYCVSVERIDAKTKEKKESSKKEISYGTWLQKQELDRTFVEKLLQDHGLGDITIPESHYAVKTVKKRNSAKKSPSTSSDGETSSVEEDGASIEDPVKKRGRPKKNDADKPPVDPNAPKKKRGRPKKESKPIVEEDGEVSSVEDAATNEPAPAVVTEQPQALEEDPEQDELSVASQELDWQTHECVDEEGNRTFALNGNLYTCDDENEIFLLDENNDPVEAVGTWDVEEKKPVWNADYEP